MTNNFSEINAETTTLSASRTGWTYSQVLVLLLGTLVIVSVWLPGMSAANDAKLQLHSETKTHLASLSAIDTAKNSPVELPDNRVTIVTFFASWCPPCLDEFHALNAVKEEFGNDISIVAINAFEEFDSNDDERMQLFLTQTKPAFPLVEASDETLKLFGNVNRIPTLYIFDQKGNQAFNFIHARGATKRSADSDELISAIRPLL